MWRESGRLYCDNRFTKRYYVTQHSFLFSSLSAYYSWWHLFRCRTHVGVPAWRCGDRNADGHTLLHATVHGQHELALSPLRLASSVLVSPPIRREPAAACRREFVGGGNGSHDAGHARHAGRDGCFLTRHTGLFYCAPFHRVSTDRSSFGFL